MERLAKLATTKIKRLMSQLKDNRAQQVSEYAVLIAVVLAAVIGMEVYVRRGLQARYYGAVLSATKELQSIKQRQGIYVPVQYEPYYLDSITEVKQTSNKQMSYVPNLNTSTNSQSVLDSKGTQRILSGNYGD